MVKIKKLVLLLIIILGLSSCMEILYKTLTPNKPKPTKFEKCKNSICKEVIIIPMVHLAKPKYYEESKRIITNLRRKNYSFFYERVAFPNNADSLKLDTLKRKMRKLVGLAFGFNLTNPKFRGAYPKFFSSGKYKMQNPDDSGYSYQVDRLVDLSVLEVLNAYEQKFGKIKLTECDFKTKFDDKYWCDNLKNKDYVIKDLREKFIIKEVEKSNEKKIGLIYGKIHTKGFEDRLLELGYSKVKYND